MKNRHDKERKVYECYDRSEADTVFNVRVAGETYPDPYYYMERDEEQLAFNEYYCNTGVFILEYVKSGKGYIECDGVKHEVGAGDFYLITPFAPHCYYSDSKDPFNKLFLNLDGTLVASMVKGIRINAPVTILHKDLSKEIEHIHSLLTRDDLSRTEMLDRAAVKVCELLLYLKPRPKSKRVSNALAAEIRQYINENISSDIDLETICKYFYISKSNLISMFSEEFGQTPHKYIIEKRIESAKKLLQNNDLTIAEVGHRVGFEGEKYFYSVFKKVTSMTPGTYRASIKRDKKIPKN